MLHNLKVALAERRLRQLDVAIALGLSQSVVSEVMHGRRSLDLEQQRTVAELLRADREWLFSQARVIPAPRSAERREPQAAIACAPGE